MLLKKIFLNNIYELKLRLYYLLFTVLLIYVISFYFYENILFILVNPIFKYMNSPRFIFNNLIDIFYLNIEIAFYISIIVLIISFFLHLSFFLWNALYIYEQHMFKKLFFYNVICFLCIFYLIYFILIPLFWKYFLYFENNFLFPLHFEAQIKNYIDFLLKLLFNSFLIFESFFFFFCYLILIKNSFNLNFLRKRKFIYTIFLLLSTLVTPPDVISQLLLLIIFICIFEIYIYILFYYFKILEVRQAECNILLK